MTAPSFDAPHYTIQTSHSQRHMHAVRREIDLTAPFIATESSERPNEGSWRAVEMDL